MVFCEIFFFFFYPARGSPAYGGCLLAAGALMASPGFAQRCLLAAAARDAHTHTHTHTHTHARTRTDKQTEIAKTEGPIDFFGHFFLDFFYR